MLIKPSPNYNSFNGKYIGNIYIYARFPFEYKLYNTAISLRKRERFLVSQHIEVLRHRLLFFSLQMGRRSLLLLLLLVLLFLLTIPVRSQRTKTEDTRTEFIFQGFSGRQSEIWMEGDAQVNRDGLLRPTDRIPNSMGTTFYRKAVRLLDKNASVRSFSTWIVFAINPTSSKEGGYGFTFTLSISDPVS